MIIIMHDLKVGNKKNTPPKKNKNKNKKTKKKNQKNKQTNKKQNRTKQNNICQRLSSHKLATIEFQGQIQLQRLIYEVSKKS